MGKQEFMSECARGAHHEKPGRPVDDGRHVPTFQRANVPTFERTNVTLDTLFSKHKKGLHSWA